MSFPVIVEQTSGQFCASVVGAPELRYVGPSRDAAIAGLQTELSRRASVGELIALEVPGGVSSLAGQFADDPTLADITAEIYQARDAEMLP